MPRYVLAAIGALAAALAVWFFLSRPSDEKQIREKLSRLSASVSVDDGDTNPLVRTSRINGDFREIFDDAVSISIQEMTLPRPGRQGLADLATQASAYLRKLDLTFDNVAIRFDPPKRSAQVKAIATVNAAERRGKAWRETRDVDLFFVKSDGWKISSVTVWEKKD